MSVRPAALRSLSIAMTLLVATAAAAQTYPSRPITMIVPYAAGGTSDEWSRLIRSYVVLGERQKAATALDKARRSLAQDTTAKGQVEAMAAAGDATVVRDG